MGEGRLTGDESPPNRRLTVHEAAARLGMTEAAVRGRIKRGTLRSYREARTVYVVLEGDAPPSNRDEPDGSPPDQSELVAVLREQLDLEREANRENRRIIAALTSRIPQLEAPPQASGGPETVEEEPEGAEPRSATGGAHEPTQGAQRRSWWRRLIGG